MGKSRQLNCKLDNGIYKQNNQTNTKDKRIGKRLKSFWVGGCLKKQKTQKIQMEKKNLNTPKETQG